MRISAALAAFIAVPVLLLASSDSGSRPAAPAPTQDHGEVNR